MAIYDNRVCKQCGRTFSGMKIKSYAPKIAGTKTEKFTAENTKEIIPAERRKQNDG